MDCREFRSKHAAFLDNDLAPSDIPRANGHLMECQRCADHDASVRRALLVFRNIAPIRPSAEFSARLSSKLAAARALGPSTEPLFAGPAPSRLPMMSGILTLAAGLVLMTVAFQDETQRPTYVTLAPVVASSPEPSLSPITSPAIAASISAGLPVWPALLMAERASKQFADAEFQFASYTQR